MKKVYFFALVIIALAAASVKYKPTAEKAEIKWLTWKQMQEAQKIQKRKVFVDVYTDWCGWCKRMDATTFADPEIVKYANENFYAIKFDAETREVINYKGKDYKYVAQGYRGYNELAADILGGQMSYPTSVYLDENLEQIFPVPGYQEPKVFETVLHFVSSNSYKTGTFEKYQAEFVGNIK